MMSVIGQSFANSSSSIMQAKYLKFIDDYLIAPVSGFELSMSFIIGAILRGVINGILIILTVLLVIHHLMSLKKVKSEVEGIVFGRSSYLNL